MEKRGIKEVFNVFFPVHMAGNRGQLKLCEQPVLYKAPARVLQALGGPGSIIWGSVVNGSVWFMTERNLTFPHLSPSVH